MKYTAFFRIYNKVKTISADTINELHEKIIEIKTFYPAHIIRVEKQGNTIFNI